MLFDLGGIMNDLHSFCSGGAQNDASALHLSFINADSILLITSEHPCKS